MIGQERVVKNRLLFVTFLKVFEFVDVAVEVVVEVVVEMFEPFHVNVLQHGVESAVERIVVAEGNAAVAEVVVFESLDYQLIEEAVFVVTFHSKAILAVVVIVVAVNVVIVFVVAVYSSGGGLGILRNGHRDDIVNTASLKGISRTELMKILKT